MNASVKQFADVLVKAREQCRPGDRMDLLTRIERLCNRWTHHTAYGFDAEQRSEEERAADFERALELLVECHEELMDY